MLASLSMPSSVTQSTAVVTSVWDLNLAEVCILWDAVLLGFSMCLEAQKQPC